MATTIPAVSSVIQDSQPGFEESVHLSMPSGLFQNAQENHGLAVPTPSVPEDFADKEVGGKRTDLVASSPSFPPCLGPEFKTKQTSEHLHFPSWRQSQRPQASWLLVKVGENNGPGRAIVEGRALVTAGQEAAGRKPLVRQTSL